jgi:hypothetical protein
MCFDSNIGVNKEDNEGRSSNNNLESGSNNESDLAEELEEVTDTDWSMDAFEYQNVRVSFKDFGENLIQKLREGVDRLRNRINCIHQTQSFESGSHCEELELFTSVADLEIFQHLIQFLNKNRNTEDPVDSFNISKFIRCTVLCAYYQKRPGLMVKNLSLFPGFATEPRKSLALIPDIKNW